ncbi:MAG: chemotaxis protein CheY [Paenibacillaceae bacterium]|nr:chemotaxis protein CheY [Paenibacillaceae bacterium]
MLVHKNEWKKNIHIEFLDTRLEQAAPIEHFHQVYEIAFFIKANVQIFVSNFKYDIRDGDLLLISPFDIHRIFYHPNFHYVRYVIYFDKACIQEILRAVNRPDLLEELDRCAYRKVALDLKQQAQMGQLCRELLQEAGHQPPDPSVNQLHLSLLLVRLREMMHAQKHQYQDHKKEQKVRLLIDYIDAHYPSAIELARLEKAAGMSKYYMSHIFKETTGMTIIEYVHNRRVIEAQKLLLQTAKSIVDICFETGFQNLQHFGRVFKKITDMSPSQYRRTR